MKLLTFLFIIHCSTAFAQFQYVSPVPGSTLVSPEHSIIIREGNLIDPSSLDKNLFAIQGSRSGDHTFRMVLSKDEKTILLYPDHPFGYDEVVNVSVSSGLKMLSGNLIGPYSFNFSTHREYSESEKQNFKNVKQLFMSEGVDKSNVKAENWHAQAYRLISGSFTVVNDSNPTPGDIFYDAWNATLNGTGNYYNGYNIITPQGDSVFASKRANFSFDFSINPDGYLSVYNDSIGAFNILDSGYHVIDTYYPGNGYGSDPHEFTRLANGFAFMIANETHVVDMTSYGGSPNATVTTTIVQEFDQDKNVIFEWRAWDHIGFNESNQNLKASYIDLIHTNSIEVDTDGNIIVSHRHLNQVDKIDINTGDFIWRLGGVMNQFTFINEPEPFTYQHDCRRISNGDITLWDNGNGHVPQHSEAKEYKLDLVNKTATLMWFWQPKNYFGGNAFYLAMGSVQRLSNGNTLINGGMDNSSNESNFWEVTQNGQIVWEVALDNSTSLVSYRALKYNWDPCAPVINNSIKVKNLTAHSAKVYWEDVNNSTSYDIQYRKMGTTVWKLKTTTDPNKNLTNLLANTTYQYQVRAHCANGFASDWSPIKKFTTPPQRLTNEEESVVAFQLHPNPTDGILNVDINLDEDQPITFSVYDLSGRLVYTSSDDAAAGQQSFQFDLRPLTAGVYLSEIKTESGVTTMKFVKQ